MTQLHFLIFYATLALSILVYSIQSVRVSILSDK